MYIHGAKRVAVSPKIDDNTNLATLSALDQVRLVLKHMTKNDMEELENAEKLSAEKLSKLGALNSLIDAATTEMNKQKENSVMLNISSVFLPYIDEAVSADTGWGRFYDIEVYKRNIPTTVHHFFLCQIKKRGVA